MSDDDKDINWLLLAITLMTIAMIVVAILDHIWRLIAQTSIYATRYIRSIRQYLAIDQTADAVG